MILGSLRGKLLAWPAGVGFDIFALLFLFIFFFFFGAVMMMLKIRRSLLESTWRCGFTGFCETQRPLGAECRMKKQRDWLLLGESWLVCLPAISPLASRIGG